MHHGVDAAAHARFARNFVRVDDEETGTLFNQTALHVSRQMLPDLLSIERRIEQERSAGREVPEHVVGLEQKRLMAGDELRLLRSDTSIVSGAGRTADAKSSVAPDFLRIVNEISLGEVVGVFADNFDRFLVRAHRSIRAQAEKLRAHDVVRFDREIRIEIADWCD